MQKFLRSKKNNLKKEILEKEIMSNVLLAFTNFIADVMLQVKPNWTRFHEIWIQIQIQ